MITFLLDMELGKILKFSTVPLSRTLVVISNFCCEGDCEAAVSQAEQGSNHPDNRLYMVIELRHSCPCLPIFPGGSYQKVDIRPAVIN